MELPIIESNNTEVSLTIATSASSNQFIADHLELPDDTFRMSLDNFSVIGENVTIGDRDVSVDSNALHIVETSELGTPTPVSTPDTLKPLRKSPPIIETPKPESKIEPARRPPTLLQLSLAKKSEDDLFVKPSPVVEVMSPAKMLQYELEPSSATPTMKRAVIDFDFFNKHKFTNYFADEKQPVGVEQLEPTDDSAYKETPVIVKVDTVRHEIGYVYNPDISFAMSGVNVSMTEDRDILKKPYLLHQM